MRRATHPAITLAIWIFAAATAPCAAGGFAVADQSAHAAGLAGAFTAQAGAPSSLYYNVGGAAFLGKKAHAVGLLHRSSWDFTFENVPVSGGVATFFEQDDPGLLAHGYTIHPLKPYLKLGLAVYSPFDLDATWNNADTFPGRTTAFTSEISTLDVNPSLALRLGERLGLGLGVIYRTSTLTVGRRLQTQDFNGQLVDFATLEVDSGRQDGFGWNAGMLNRVSGRFSWGLSYRSAIKIDYGGGATLTQVTTGNDQLDMLLAQTNPFGQDLASSTVVELPQLASFGVALGSPANKLLVAADVNWTGWSSFEELDLDIPSFQNFNALIPTRLEDSFTYRLGLQYTTPPGSQFRVGYAFEESPQPPSTVGPFLYDGDRNRVTLGFGRDWLDVALTWTDLASRPAGSESGPDGQPPALNGLFEGQSIETMITIKKK